MQFLHNKSNMLCVESETKFNAAANDVLDRWSLLTGTNNKPNEINNKPDEINNKPDKINNVSDEIKDKAFQEILDLKAINYFQSIIIYKAFKRKYYDLLDKFISIDKQQTMCDLMFEAGRNCDQDSVKEIKDFCTSKSTRELGEVDLEFEWLQGLGLSNNINASKLIPLDMKDYKYIMHYAIVIYNFITYKKNDIFDKINPENLKIFCSDVDTEHDLYYLAVQVNNMHVVSMLTKYGLSPPVDSIAYLFSSVILGDYSKVIDSLSHKTLFTKLTREKISELLNLSIENYILSIWESEKNIASSNKGNKDNKDNKDSVDNSDSNSVGNSDGNRCRVHERIFSYLCNIFHKPAIKNYFMTYDLL